jgi:hypothetical protein
MSITCPKYVPIAGRRCAYYLDNGACVRPDLFMCVEWLVRNATLPQKADSTRTAALAHLHGLRSQVSHQTGAGR